MASWAEFDSAAPEFATAGRRLLTGPEGIAIGFLATITQAKAPRLAPVCPIFCGDHLYLSAGAHTPKVRDLSLQKAYVLHAFLGENDEEFQISGTASEVMDPEERAAVHEAISFPAFDASDPVFRFDIERALWVHWERAGQPDTKAVPKRWVSP
jgi:hypothetical protein